jgi:putative tryptophan/tyrosine transport system substrate-binding protein
VFALKRATVKIPIVAVIGFDPVKAGLVASLARPGGNITGVTLQSIETGSKRVELLKEAFPGTQRIYYLNQKTNLHFIERDREQARRLGVEMVAAPIDSKEELEAFFARRFHAEAVSVATSGLNYVLRTPMIAAAHEARVPVAYPFVECVYEGGLMAYAGDLRFAMGRAMHLMAQILNGANPAELAFEQSSRISLVVNMKTAQALQMAIPESVLLRADEVIR